MAHRSRNFRAFDPHTMKGGSVSPFRRRRRIGLRPARPKALEADAMAEAVGAAPFAEPERRLLARLPKA